MMEFWLNRGLVCVLMLLLVSFAQGQTANHRATDPEAPAVAPPLALVNVMQGTDSERAFSHGNTLPLVGAPWGMTDWSVQNREGINERWFYQSRNTMFYGFRATHSPCPWAGDYGHFMVSPQTGPVLKSVADGGCEYDPAQTVMRPDYARVQLNRYHLTAELTASERCSMLRLQFNTGQPGNAAQPSADKTGRLVFDFPGGAQLITQGNRIWGYSQYHGGAAEGDFHCYFVGELDRAVTAASQVGTAQTPGAGAGYIEFDLSRPTVEIKLATSYISPEQAWRNLEIETRGGFEAMRERTAVAWGEKLNRISVDGTPEQRATFYSCLYRTMKFPHKLYEMDAGQKPIHYSPWDGKIHPGVAYTDSGLWDTFRTLFPFYSIVYPQQLSEIVSGWLNAYREGGWLPEWPNPGGFRGMPGSHANAMVVDAMAKGITGFDYNTAYEALHHDAFDIPPRSKHPGGRAGLGVYLKLGYLPPKAAEYWVSNTLDYAYDDWCVAQAAKLMHQTADYQTLMQRSLNYRNLWDPAVQFMRSKDATGQWSDSNFDEFAWGGAYAESGPWQASWAVQHDVLGLADLVGGPAAFGEKLDRLFHQPSVFHTGAYGGEIHEMTEFAAVEHGTVRRQQSAQLSPAVSLCRDRSAMENRILDAARVQRIIQRGSGWLFR